MRPAPGPDSRRRSNRRGAAADENPGARDVPIRPAIRSLDRLDAEGSFYRRQGPARRHHASRRRGFAQRIGGGSDSAPQVCSKRQKQKCALALARYWLRVFHFMRLNELIKEV